MTATEDQPRAGKYRNRIVEVLHDVRIGDLIPAEANPKIHGKRQLAVLAAHMEQNGIVDAVRCWRDAERRLHLWDGHGRQAVDPDERWTVLVTDHSPEEAERLMLTFDEVGFLRELDPVNARRALEADTTSKGDLAKFLIELSGTVSKAEAKDAKARRDANPKDERDGPEPKLDRADELQEHWHVSLGDLWFIPSLTVSGHSHRILCGDALDPISVRELLGAEERLDLLVTSPPYWTGQEYDRTDGIAGIGDFIDRATNLWSRLIRRRIVIQTGHTNSTICGEGGPMRKVLLDALWTEHFENGTDREAWYLRSRRAWIKGGGFMQVGPKGDLIDESWELILTFYRAGHNEGGQERTLEPWAQMGYWDDVVGVKNDGHPAVFPVEIPRRIILLYSSRGETVVDPFLGSGATLVACEQEGRLGYGAELEPKYVAVALQRLADMGLQPRKVE